MDLSLKIDVVDTITPEEFDRKYFKPQRPVLIKNLAFEQPAGGKWSIDYFRDNMGDAIVDLTDNNNKRHEKSTTITGDIKMPLRDYMDIIEKDEKCDLRLFRFNLYKPHPELKEDFSCPPIMKSIMSKHGFMFLGGKDTDVRVHYDIDNSSVLLTQFHGEKRVVLFPPEYSALLYRLPFNTHSLVDLINPDYEKFPGLKYVKGYDFIMEPGNAVFMPSGYWHYNTYINGGISVAYRKLGRFPFGLLKGAMNLGMMMPFDKTMNFLFGETWMKRKLKIGQYRVNKAIKQKEKAKS